MQLSGWSFAQRVHWGVWSIQSETVGLSTGYFGGRGFDTAGLPLKSAQQSLSSPDLSNPQYLGGVLSAKSKK